MKAAQINAYGGKEVVTITEVAQPEASEGQVVIEVHAAGINPIDWKIQGGQLKEMVPLQFPKTMGMDLSGVVSAAGEGVSDFQVGDEVYGQANFFGGSGSLAEFAIAGEDSLAAKPTALPHAEAAGLPLAGVSAVQALTEHLQLSSGQKILIHGAAGGIGSFAVQLAKHLGAYVAATAAAEDSEFVKGLGADEVIDYKSRAFDEMPHDYDAVFDTIGGETYAKSFKVMKQGGIIVSMVEQPNAELAEEFGVTPVAQSTQVNHARLAKLTDLVNRGFIKVAIDESFPLEQAGKALDYLKKGHQRGKVVVNVR